MLGEDKGESILSDKFNRSTGWIVKRRWLTALVLGILSAIAIGGYTNPDWFINAFKAIDEEPTELFVDEFESDGEENLPVPAVSPIQLTGYDVVIVAQSDSFFTTPGATAIRRVVDRLESMDCIDEVMWMDKIPVLNIFGLNEPLLPKAQSAPERFAAARKKAKNHPLVNGQLLSEDGRTLILMLRIDYLFVENDDLFDHQLREVAEEEASTVADVDMTFSVTGKVPIHLTAMRSQQDNQLKYQIIAYGMILLLSVILFRGVSAVVIVALAPALGVFWTLGFIRYLEFQFNPFNDVVLPVLVALVGFTDGVHLMVQIRRERAAGLNAYEAAKVGVSKVGLACFLTSLTTAVGFGSLALAHHELVREFGYCCVIGVTLSFASVVLSIPLTCSTWLGRRIHIGYGKGYVDKNLSRIGGVVEFVLRHRNWVSVSGIILSLTCFFVSLSLRPDDRQSNILPTKSEASVAIRKLDAAMGGLEPANVNISWIGRIDGADTELELLTVLEQIDQLLRKESTIGHPISLYNLLDALPGDGGIESKASMVELLPPPLKRAFYTPEIRNANVVFKVQDLGIARYGPVFQRIKDGLRQINEKHPRFEFSLSGAPIWRWENIYEIVVDLTTSLGVAALIIFGILSLVYRSLRIGLISLLPNLFPLCVAGVYLVVTGQSLEVVTVCAFTCCLGIAVDDTIHFLTRFVEEKRETDDDDLAIRRAFTAVGTALVMTTLVLVSGFLTVLFSDAREHRIFASMGAITVASALFGDLVFLPPLLARFGKKKSANSR